MNRRRGRYLGVLRGSNEVARNKLLAYFRGETSASYPRAPGNSFSRTTWVRPFGLDLPNQKKIQVIHRGGGVTSELTAVFNGFAFGAPAEADRILLKDWSPPRAAIVKDRAASGTRQTSQLTGRRYKSYGGEGRTLPFGAGQHATQKDEGAVFRIIHGRVKAQDPRWLCSYIPGTFSQ